MNNGKNRVLGRVLAVEEIRNVSGAQQYISTIIDIDGVQMDTNPAGADISNPTNTVADSGTAQDTGAYSDSGTAADTGALSDCVSNTRRDICPPLPYDE